MVKPPIVYLAGILRALGRGIDNEAWVWLSDDMGQMLFWPPNVAGWDDNRWLDTSRMRARWEAVYLRARDRVDRSLGRGPARLRPCGGR